MRSSILWVAMLACCATAHGASPQTPSTPGDACVSLNQVGGFRTLDSRTAVLFSIGGKPSYVLTLAMPLHELEHALSYAFVHHDGDGRLCGRSQDAIAVPGAVAALPARILSMKRLDEAGIRALEEQYDVRLTKKRRTRVNPAASATPADAI
jgi:hypothetical protein